MTSKFSVFWFRRDLRLDDNAGLYHALSGEFPVQPIFIFDTDILDRLNDKSDRRVSFIYDRVHDLKAELQAIRSDLKVFYGKPKDVILKLSTSGMSALFTNRDYEPYARSRDKEIFDLLSDKNISFKGYKDHVVFEKNEVIKADGSPYTVYTPYSRKWKERFNNQAPKKYPSQDLLSNCFRGAPETILQLSDMGFQPHKHDWQSLQIDQAIISNYHKNRDIPSINGTTRLSVHIRFGTVSIRVLAQIAAEQNEKWLNELIWRDFYQAILWHFPHVAEGAFRPKYDRIIWRNDESEFQAWCDGKTGYPLVDAGMRELNQTGFMHNRVRMVVASFLTKHLLIDWRWGEAYFAQKLIDFDLASNNGGWQWASSSGVDAAPYFRVFNPTLQAQRFDPEAKYIRKWVPEIDSPNYPDPIVDHKMARDRAIEHYKLALQP